MGWKTHLQLSYKFILILFQLPGATVLAPERRHLKPNAGRTKIEIKVLVHIPPAAGGH
jgi:hypothetical protein